VPRARPAQPPLPHPSLISRRPLTEAERAEANDARAHAAAAAEARAKAAENTPFGRAAKKAQADARRPEPARGTGGSNAADWLS
jgi:hypothetical protein